MAFPAATLRAGLDQFRVGPPAERLRLLRQAARPGHVRAPLEGHRQRPRGHVLPRRPRATYAYLLKSLPTSAAPLLQPRLAGSTLAPAVAATPALVPTPVSATACALGPHSPRALRQASCPSSSVRLQVAHDARTPGGLADLASGTHEVCTSTTRLPAFQFGGVSQSSRLGVTPRPPCSGCPVRRFPNLAVWCNAQVFFTDSDFICRTRRRLWKPWYSRG